ncbi:MAG: hypothetical protein AB4057_15415 [Crocosphaera sp.]
MKQVPPFLKLLLHIPLLRQPQTPGVLVIPFPPMRLVLVRL